MMRTTRFQRPMERRTTKRLPCRAPVRIYATPGEMSDSFVLESSNMSPDGVFLRTDLLLEEGAWLELEFVVPGRAQPVRGRGQVVRVDLDGAPPGPGMAVHLPDLGDDERTALGRIHSADVREAAL